MTSRHSQAGAYLLEALIGILIFSLGILGIVGLQAASLRSTTDEALRAEAVLAANKLIGQMWADDETQLQANYSSALGTGQPYKNFVIDVSNAFGGAYDPAQPPSVCFNCSNAAPSTSSASVDILISWKTTDSLTTHSYTTSAVIGANFN